MKRLLFLIPLLFSVHIYGSCPPNRDTITSGSIGLITPPTGYLDCVRFDDKMNMNFRIIAATMGTTMNQVSAVALDTGTLRSTMYTLINATQTNVYTLINSTRTNIYTLINSTQAQSYTITNSTFAAIQSTASNLADNTGTINTVGNPVDWNKLKNVPAGFADGSDDGSAGGTGFIGSTITKILACNGEQFFATTSFIPCQGAWDNIGRTTFVVTALQAFTNIPSTVGATSYRIVDSSSAGGNTPFSYVSPNVVVDTFTRFSVWTATRIPIWADHTFALHITTAPITGTMSAEGGFKIEGFYLLPGPTGTQGP